MNRLYRGRVTKVEAESDETPRVRAAILTTELPSRIASKRSEDGTKRMQAAGFSAHES
jgi:hypothetical protein